MLTSFFEELHRLLVIDETGAAIGEVQDLVIDTGTLQLAALRIALQRGVAREIGARWRVFRAATIDVPARYMRAVAGGILLLSLSRKELVRLAAVAAASRSIRLELATRARLH
jgi:sporulation protein YlmC with PRC-barrel domain